MGCRYLRTIGQRVQAAVAARILGSEFVGGGTRTKVILVSFAIPRTCLCAPLCRWLLLSPTYGMYNPAWKSETIQPRYLRSRPHHLRLFGLPSLVASTYGRCGALLAELVIPRIDWSESFGLGCQPTLGAWD